MKVVHFFIHLFSVLVYLTLGSLLIIVALRIVALEDALVAVRGMYRDLYSSLRTFFLGALFIFVGLAFAKIILKKTKTDGALVIQSDRGRITVSIPAIGDIVKKALKKFLVIKDSKLKILVEDNRLELRLRLNLWFVSSVAQLIKDVQDEIRQRLERVLGIDSPVEITVEVAKVEEHGMEDEILQKSQVLP